MIDEIRDILAGSRATLMQDFLGIGGLFLLLFAGLHLTGAL